MGVLVNGMSRKGHKLRKGRLLLIYMTMTRLFSLIYKLNERQAAIVESRFFGGLAVEETAEALGISEATVQRDWRAARAWLGRELRRAS